MFSQSLETFLYGGPSVPLGYQSLTGTFSGASPQPIEHELSTGNNGTCYTPIAIGVIFHD